ncbi:MAG: Arc family DNA binding domain-containing protein [Lysobacterales bacterium]
MSARKAYPLRIGTDVLDAMQRWADDDLRSLNAQIEYVLRETLRQHSRLRTPGPSILPLPKHTKEK